MAFSVTGPWQFNPPKEFGGKKEDFEEFAFKLKAYLSIMNASYTEDLRRIEENMDVEIVESHFTDSARDPIEGLRERERLASLVVLDSCGRPCKRNRSVAWSQA